MKKPRVTIAIPAHQAEAHLAECLESSLAQTEDGIEIRVIDDGSSDGTAEIAKSFADRIHFRSRENRGSNPTRNELLAEAEGEWIQFLDADDFLLPEKIGHNLVAVDTAGSEVDAVWGPVLEQAEDGSRSQPEFDDAEDLFVKWTRWQFCQTGGVLWRTESLRKIGGWNEDYPCCQDNEVCSRALQEGLGFAFDPQAGAVYRVHEGTLSRKTPLRVIRRKMTLQREMLDWLEEEGRATEEHRRCTGRALFESLRMMARHDLAEAAQMERSLSRSKELLALPPAAPFFYRAIRRLFGFSTAERLAAALRR